VEKFHQLMRIAADLLHRDGLRNSIQMFAYVMRAASGWSDDMVELAEVLHEQRFRPGRILLAAAVGHHLPAAGLVERIDDLDAEPFQQLQRGNADRREEGVDVTGNEQSHFHH
jgi:hypothetical protein